jgi:aminodeoxyfutalosine synthase
VKHIIEKLETKKRLSYKDGIALWDLDIFTLGKFANKKRTSLWNNKTFFNINRHINPTNVCVDTCKFCAYSASRKNPNQYTMSIKEVLDIAKSAVDSGAKELHIVSAHNDKIGMQWYFDIIKACKQKYPDIHIKAFTAAEVHFLATSNNKSYDEIIDGMLEAGVDSMPGGGAEIFDEKIRDYICKGKVSSKEWLEIHQKWHQRDKQSNATMLFGHIEKREDRIDHMIRLRDLQDKTDGFNAFIPLVYQQDNNFLNVKDFITGQEILKTMAISRLILDNIPHIKSYWVTSTLKLALVSQEFGADDMDGTIQRESINSAAGANSKYGLGLDILVSQIQNSGFRAIQRDSLYNELEEY